MPGRTPEPLAPAELLPLTAEPVLTTPSEADLPCLVLDLTGNASLTPDETARLGAWLRQQNHIVIGVGDPDRALPWLEALDALVTPAGLAGIIAGIRSNPTAASVLTHVLRVTEHLPAADALVVESLAYATLQAGAEHRTWLAAERAARPGRSLEDQPDMVELTRLDGTLHVRLNSPATRNALSVPMRDALCNAFALVAMDDTIEAVEVSANGPCFSAGGDLKEFGLVPDPATAHRIRMERMPARYLLARREKYVFRLHGACIGAGIELPAFARRVTARPDTFFRLPEVGMGLIPGAGGCVSIARRIGRRRTAVMAITGEDVGVDTALSWGLIDGIED